MKPWLHRRRTFTILWLSLMFAGVAIAGTELSAEWSEGDGWDQMWCEAETSSSAVCYWHWAWNNVCQTEDPDLLCDGICGNFNRSSRWAVDCTHHEAVPENNVPEHDFLQCSCGAILPEG